MLPGENYRGVRNARACLVGDHAGNIPTPPETGSGRRQSAGRSWRLRRSLLVNHADEAGHDEIVISIANTVLARALDFDQTQSGFGRDHLGSLLREALIFLIYVHPRPVPELRVCAEDIFVATAPRIAQRIDVNAGRL